MKTTIDKSNPLYEARRETPPFRLRDAAVDGRGLQPGADGLTWGQLRCLAYADRDFSRFPGLTTRNPLPA